MNTAVPAGATRAPRVLVLMATYEGERWIGEQLGSILAQRGVEVRVLVSDDCSRDRTAAVVQAAAAHDGRISLVVRAQPSGSAGANFRGLFAQAHLTAFDYVALADQDDVWELDHLARGCAALSERPHAGGYSCAVRAFGAGDESVLAQCGEPRALDYLFEGAGQGCSFVLTAGLARRVQEACRAHAAAVGALHYHDWLVYLVARTAALGWIFDPVPSLRYRQHGANEIGARSGRGAVRRRLALIRGGWYRSQVQAALELAGALVPPDALRARLLALMEAKPSALRRLRLGVLLLRQGRRRRVDRLVLALAAIAGWL